MVGLARQDATRRVLKTVTRYNMAANMTTAANDCQTSRRWCKGWEKNPYAISTCIQ